MANKNYYFDKDTENAIIKYNNTDDPQVRSRLYKEEIHDAFAKLAENIINTFKFTYFDVPQADVEKRLVSHLVEKIYMYKADKGKAFSYFSMIAKNYCILHNKNNYKRYKRQLSIDNEDLGFDIKDSKNVQAEIERQEFFDQLIQHWDENMTAMFTKERDIKIADAILELFKKRKNIETFNKKALYVMIREMTGIERTQHITKVVKKFKDEYFELSRRYHKTGSIQKLDKVRSRFF